MSMVRQRGAGVAAMQRGGVKKGRSPGAEER
jgi:hypothetical protein